MAKKVAAKKTKSKYPQTVYVTLYGGSLDTVYCKEDVVDIHDTEVGVYEFKQSGKVKTAVTVEL